MRNIKFTILILVIFGACKGDHHDDNDDTFEYHAHINSPSSDNKMMGQNLVISVDFESHTGETIHHINVSIKEATNGSIIYSKPDAAHIHQSGQYLFTDDLLLNALNGFAEHTDYIFEAKVWGHEEGLEEVTEVVQFHLHPM